MSRCIVCRERPGAGGPSDLCDRCGPSLTISMRDTGYTFSSVLKWATDRAIKFERKRAKARRKGK